MSVNVDLANPSGRAVWSVGFHRLDADGR
jgi:hypothetical protein